MPVTYERIRPARFLARPNRFIAHVELEGEEVVCHVKNTGRCRELLTPGAEVFVQEALNPARRTKYDLIAVWKGERLINMDSQIPNAVVEQWLRAKRPFGEWESLRREVAYGASRFDLCLQSGPQRMFIEVKGVTLEENGIAMFPDAPTQRGVKHLLELCRCVEDGCEAAAVFLIQMSGIRRFVPNRKTDPDFAQALCTARERGVRLLAFNCDVAPDSIAVRDEVMICL